MNNKIWVLADLITGHSNQALALARNLGTGFLVQNIEYNILAKLPTVLLGYYPVHLTYDSIVKINTTNLPKLLISAGRRTAPISLYLKHKSNGKLKIIQIMNPGYRLDEFDLIILPQHDAFAHDVSNVIRTVGALTYREQISPEELQCNYPNLQRCIAVIIGGSTKGYNFSDYDAKLLISILSDIARNHGSHFFITFSRRTPASVKQIFYKHFTAPNIIHDPDDNQPNPYLAMLSGASYIITTADSISMCSEAASTGKPLYIFYPDSLKLKKHRFFIQQLFDLGIARKLDNSVQFLQSYSYQPLNEAQRVTAVIKSQLL